MRPARSDPAYLSHLRHLAVQPYAMKFVGVIGGIGIVIALIAAFGSGNGEAGVAIGLLLAVGIAIYVVLIWAGIQLSSLIAGYIYTRTADSDLG